MNALRNKVQLIGRVGSTPEVKEVGQGKKVVNVSLATNEVYYNEKGEKEETTQWHHLVSWNHAEIFEKFVEKGKEIAIEGKLTYRNYEDKEGNKRYVTEVIVQEVLLL